MIDLKDYLECHSELNQFINEILEPYYKNQRNAQAACERAMEAYEDQRKLTIKWMKLFRRAFLIQSIVIAVMCAAIIIQAVI